MGNSLKNKNIRRQRTDELVHTSDSISINDLPIEMIVMILKYLDRGDLFKYESVCKKWRYFVKGVVNQKLVIAKNGKLKPRHWFFLDGERCPPASVMLRDALDIELVEGSFMFNLKQLKICDAIAKHECMEPVALLMDAKLINQLVNLGSA